MLLDPILQGGLPPGTSIALVGPPGSGKTCFSLQLALEAINQGRDALYLSTENTPTTIIEQAQNFGIPLPKNPEKNPIQYVDAYSWRIGMQKDPYALSRISNPGNLNEVNLIITDQAKLLKPGSIIIIDSVSGLSLSAPDEQRIRTFVHSLAQRIINLGKILVLILEDEAHDSKLITNLRSLVQGSVHTKTAEDTKGALRWYLRLYSLIGVNHDTQWCEVNIGKKGLALKGGAKSE
ncbi:MAG: RAD55 family ATPase [Candidatus Hermodarchaeia archaeon]